MAETVIGVFTDMPAAERAVHELENNGFGRETISVVASDKRAAGAAPGIGPVQELQKDTGVGAGAGAAIGAVAGAIAALAIPGLGPIFAYGPLVPLLTGAGAGAAAGGVIGGLVSWGVPEKEAKTYTEAVKRGSVLVAVHTPKGRAQTAIDLMNRDGALDLIEQERQWTRTDTRRDDDADLVDRVEQDTSSQTGRTRSGGAGARGFIW